MLFGDKSGGEPWALDVLTLDHLVSGQVGPGAQKRACAYHSMTENGTPRALELTASGTRSTGSLAAPERAGKTVGFSFRPV